MLASDSFPPSTLASLLMHLHRATELHNDSMGASDDNESVMTLVNIRSRAQMIYSISMIAHGQCPPFPVVCLCLQPLEDSVETLTATLAPKQGMREWRPHAVGR